MYIYIYTTYSPSHIAFFITEPIESRFTDIVYNVTVSTYTGSTVEMINKYKDKSTKYTNGFIFRETTSWDFEHPKVLKTNGVINLEQAQGGSCFTCFALECHVQGHWFCCRWSVG